MQPTLAQSTVGSGPVWASLGHSGAQYGQIYSGSFLFGAQWSTRVAPIVRLGSLDSIGVHIGVHCALE
eukprot:11202258-Lingulodinium_polyedra.AAC.1